MPVPNSQDTATSQNLTSTLLTSTALAHLDKKRFLQSYIRSQSTYRNHFVKEGRKDQLAWERGDPCLGQVERRDVDTAEEAGFSTPKLKARVPEPPKAKTQEKQHKKRGRDTTEPDENPRRKQQRVEASSSTVPPAPYARLKGDAGANVGDTRKKLGTDVIRPRSPNKLDQHLKPKESQSTKSVRKRERSPEESERGRILADRRERRRVKKAIVSSIPRDEEGKSENAASTERKRDKKERKERKSKGKATNLTAGLALMHGFSATNVGKGRLTLKPSYGVFHKGKASAKTSVSKPKKSTTAAWSELEFLGQTPTTEKKTRTSRRRSRGVDDSRSATDDDSSTDTSSRSSCKQLKKKFKICNYEHDRVASKTTQDGEDPVEDHGTVRMANEQASRSRARSPVWDIERSSCVLDGSQEAASDAQTSRTAPSNTPTKNGTVLLDVAARWNLQDLPLRSDSLARLARDTAGSLAGQGNSADIARSFVSLCPSQSASQLPVSQPPAVTIPRPTQSRYFGAPSHPEPARLSSPARPQSQALSVDSHSQPIHQHRPSLPTPATGAADPLENEEIGATPSSGPLSALGQPYVLPPQYSSPALSYLTLDQELPGVDLARESMFVEDLYPLPNHTYQGFVPASRLPLENDTWANEYSDVVHDLGDLDAYLGGADLLVDSDYLYDATSDLAEDFVDAPLDEEDYDMELGPPLYEDALQLSSDQRLLDEPFYASIEGAGAELRLEFHDDEIGADEDLPMDAAALEGGLPSGMTYDDEDPCDDTNGTLHASDINILGPSSPLLSVTDVDSSTDLAPADSAFFPSGATARLLLHGATSAGAESVDIGWTPVASSAIARQTRVEFPTVSKVEEDVAKGLRGHWLPQRP